MGRTGDFAGTAEVYRRARRGYPGELRDHLIARRLVGPGSHVMDLGAGTGQLSLLLAAAVEHVTAVEPEPDMVRVGREATGGRPNVTWVQARDRELAATFGERTFDLVVIGNAFQHLDRESLLVDLEWLVREGGGVAVCTSSVPVWLQDTPWAEALRIALREQLGMRPGGAGVPDRDGDVAVLAASAFSDVEQWHLERRESRTVESIVGEVVSSTSGRVDQCGAEALRVALESFADAGQVSEDVVTTALIATRPEG
ncbi:MAG: class I SAM-dependent methyltransferase [Actinomycetota bacterium]|nr:class I SAM-dependent methyltransferase [Actinomycetota bacterium]